MKKGAGKSQILEPGKSNEVTINLDTRNFKSVPKGLTEEALATTLSNAGMRGTFDAHISEENHGLVGNYNWTKFRRFSNCPPAIVMNVQIAERQSIWVCAIKVTQAMIVEKSLKTRIRNAAFELKEAAIQAAPKKESPSPGLQKRKPQEATVRDVPAPENTGVTPPLPSSPRDVDSEQIGRRAPYSKSMATQFTIAKKLEFITAFIQISGNENSSITTVAFTELIEKISIQGNKNLACKFLKQKGIIETRSRGPHLGLIWLTTEAKVFLHSEQEFKRPESTQQEILRLKEALEQKTALAESLQKELLTKNNLLELVRGNLERKESAIEELRKLKTNSPANRKKTDKLGTILSECDQEDEKILATMREEEKKK